LELARLAGDGWLLHRRAAARARRLAAKAHRARYSARGGMTAERPPYLPGDPVPEAEIQRMIRVDHAGEYGAVRIYDGQLAVIRHGRGRDEIRHMAEQEARHLSAFNELVRARRVRPTLLQPVWHMAGYALGMATALLGEEAAMACTVAVEEVIDEHYRGQADRLGDGEPALKQTILAFRDEELAHRQRAIEHGATETLGYDLISGAIKAGSRLAIWLSTRI
jgi:ubiquinone biosynthesis monooxygenase Coq7